MPWTRQQSGGQDRLFYAFNRDERVPQDHLLRGINQYLDLSALRSHLADYYSNTGRSSIDPELMIRMLVIGYCFGIRSERRLCEEVHLNLVYRWFCCLGLEGKIPDYSTFSKNRHGRFRASDTFRHIFETVKQSNRMCQCGTRHNARTKRFPAAISIGTNGPTNIAAPKAMRCAAYGAHSRTRAPTSPSPTPSSTDPANSTA